LRKVTVHCEIRPENGKWLTARSRRTHSARQAAKRPEAKNGPRPALPQTTLRVPGRHAARDRNRPTGQLTLSASRAPSCNLGLGRESFFPPGLKLGPVIMSRPSQSDGCVRFPVEQNRARRPRTTLHSFCFSSAPSHAPQRATPSGRRAAAERACPRRCLEPLAGVRAHHWVDAPPSSGLSGASSRPLAPTR
jgi:hypothetical protein